MKKPEKRNPPSSKNTTKCTQTGEDTISGKLVPRAGKSIETTPSRMPLISHFGDTTPLDTSEQRPLMPVLDTAQWIKLQDEDVVLNRIKVLMKEQLLNKVEKNVEIPEVERLSRERGALIMDSNGILCRLVFAHNEK